MTVLLILSLILLCTPFFGVGVAGLVGWGMLKLLFGVADQGVEQMSTEISSGNTTAGGCWLGMIFAVVILGGIAVLGSVNFVGALLR